MPIVKFNFADAVRGWELALTDFSGFNLLVGASGVGKTRILSALNAVRNAGLRGADRAPGCEWCLELVVDGTLFTWSASTSKKPASVRDFVRFYPMDDDEEAPESEILFLKEVITKDGKTLVDRAEEYFTLDTQSLPKLKPSESAIALLKDDDRLAPLNGALRRFLFSSAHQQFKQMLPYDKKELLRIGGKIESIEQLRDSNIRSTLLKGLILHDRFQEEFDKLRQAYIEIFSQVEDVKIGAASDFESELGADDFLPLDWITIGIRERGIPFWLVHQRVSSGMLRTLAHLLELALAPPGTVILIDEFENGLGVNCLPQVSNNILSREDLQFIVTSHHPHVINSVSPKSWRIVTRDGSLVSVQDYRTIQALSTASHHDAFTILMNLPEIERGVA